MTIGEQLKKKRIELQMSQEVAADKAGISRRTLAYYESGERTPNAENLLILCNLYGLNINELIVRDINENENKEDVPVNANKDDALAKIDRYLQYERDKKETIRKTAFMIAIIVSIFAAFICVVLIILKFVLMNLYNYSFSEASAQMWTSLFNALITFVNDPDVKGFPIVSVSILCFIVLGWGIYFIIKKIKKNINK